MNKPETVERFLNPEPLPLSESAAAAVATNPDAVRNTNMSISLSITGKQVYSGTVSHKTKTARRAANRVAKASRKTNRNR